MAWLIPFSSLTPDQQSAAMLSSDSHRVIVGGPGSGKTLVLLHRFAFLYQRYGQNMERCRFFAFTTTLKDFIKSALPEVEVPDDLVTTFDKWCFDFYKKHIGRSVPRVVTGKFTKPDFAKIRSEVHAAVVGRNVARQSYDFIVVDEGQDLTIEAIEIIAALSKHVTVAMDGKQQLYDEGAAEDGVLRALNLKRKNVSLVAGFRCNPMVTALAAHFLPNPDQQLEFKQQSKVAPGARLRPLLLVSSDWEAEKMMLADLMRVRLAASESIGVLFPRRNQVFGYAKGFRALGFDVVTDGREGIEFGDPRPKFLTYHEAKGLTFDSVFLPRLDQSAFSESLLRRMMPMLFVGASRAVNWVCLGTLENRAIKPVQSLIDADSLPYIEVRVTQATVKNTGSTSDIHDDGDDELPY